MELLLFISGGDEIKSSASKFFWSVGSGLKRFEQQHQVVFNQN